MSSSTSNANGGNRAGDADNARPAPAATQWNWTTLAQKAVMQNASHADRAQGDVRQRVRAAASSRSASLITRPKAPTASQARRPLPSNVAKSVSDAPVKTIGAEKTDPLVVADAKDVEKFTRLRIGDRAVSVSDLETEMTGRRFVALRDMDVVSRDVLADEKVDWVTIGVVARKTLSKAATNGSSFMVWGLSDLESTELGVFLFDGAYDAHWRALEGSIVAVLNATLMPASEKNKFALKASKPEEIVRLGRAIDFGVCKGMSSTDVRCRLAVNTTKSQYCLHHIAASFMAAGKRRQQLNNSFATFNKALFSSASQMKNISTGVYGVGPSPGAAASGWQPILTSKRMRTDGQRRAGAGGTGGGMLGMPTVLSASGTVIQQPSRPRTNTAILLGSREIALPDQVSSSSGAASTTSVVLSSRSQRIIASLQASNPKDAAAAMRPTKAKKIDLMKFMRCGATN